MSETWDDKTKVDTDPAPPPSEQAAGPSLSPREAAGLVLKELDEKLNPIRISLHELRTADATILLRLDLQKKHDQEITRIASRILATLESIENNENRLQALEIWRKEITQWKAAVDEQLKAEDVPAT
jgi:hypothetical protein